MKIKSKKTKVFLFILLLCILFGLSFSIFERWRKEVPNKATVEVVGVGIYQDINFTVPVTEIDWGMIEPNSSKDYPVYFRNEGTLPVQLNMTTEDWNPANASEFITLSWNYNGDLIPVDSYILVNFTLFVKPEISGIREFSFTIVVTGSG